MFDVQLVTLLSLSLSLSLCSMWHLAHSSLSSSPSLLFAWRPMKPSTPSTTKRRLSLLATQHMRRYSKTLVNCYFSYRDGNMTVEGRYCFSIKSGDFWNWWRMTKTWSSKGRISLIFSMKNAQYYISHDVHCGILFSYTSSMAKAIVPKCCRLQAHV